MIDGHKALLSFLFLTVLLVIVVVVSLFCYGAGVFGNEFGWFDWLCVFCVVFNLIGSVHSMGLCVGSGISLA